MANTESRAALAASRARIVAASDEARRRIERDLHDGTQQQLVSLMLELRAVQAAVPPQLGELRGGLSRIAAGLAGVFDQVREISHGIHPAIHSKSGLQSALKALARRSAVPVELNLRVGRLPGQVEVAAYYAVSEALANAAKHAHASVVHVELDTHDAIVLLAIRGRPRRATRHLEQRHRQERGKGKYRGGPWADAESGAVRQHRGQGADPGQIGDELAAAFTGGPAPARRIGGAEALA